MSPESDKRQELVPVNDIETEVASRIITVRGQRVVLDSDLAHFYGVETRRLTEQVSRNQARFPEDFMFHLTETDMQALEGQSQNAIDPRRRRSGKFPAVFTEQGALAVSGVLKSERAAEVSVAVARAFVVMRDQLAGLHSHPLLTEFASRLAKLETKAAQQSEFNALLKSALTNFESLIELVGGDELSDEF